LSRSANRSGTRPPTGPEARRSLLPVLTEPRAVPEVRKSRTSRWRAAVLIGFHLLIALHIAHWLATGRTVTPVEPSEAMAFSKAGIVNAGLIFFAGAILLTAIFGRWFCGWACHLVALQDLCRWLLEKIGIRPRPLRSRLLRLVPYFAFAYMFLWPAAYRLWLGDSLAVRGSELTTSAFWDTFPGWIVGALTFLICGFATVYFLGAKGFCTYACPYGAAFYTVDRLAPLRVRVTDACEGCGHCTSVCTSNVRVHEEVRDFGMVVDAGCMKCGDCVSVCPNDALYFGFGALPGFAGARRATGAASPPAPPAAGVPGPEPAKRSYPLSWGEEITLGLAFLLAFASFRGLYGEVPFLMSLGLAGVLAFLALLGLRLVTRRDLAYRHRTLKRGGRWRPAGVVFGGALLLVALFWTHSGVLQSQIALAKRAYGKTANARRLALDIAGEPAAISVAERAAARAAADRFARVEKWAIFPWRGLSSSLAWSSWIAGDLAAFRAASERAVARQDSAYDMLLLGARDAAARGDLAALTLAGERAVALAPERFEAYAGVGMLLARSGAAEAAAPARSFFERGLVHFPASTVLAYNSGVIEAVQGRTDRAIERFRQVLAVDPEHREARENLAGMLAGSGRMEEAAEFYRQAISASPQDADLHVLLAQTWMAMGKDEAARLELTAALKLAPGHPHASALAAALANQTQKH
jgi:ferredoxin-type protein NapH